jgi:hypothetical protein
VVSYAYLVQNHIASAVSFTPLGRYDIAEAGDLEFERLWLPIKGISIKKIKKANCTIQYPIRINRTQKYRVYLRIVFGAIGVIDTAEAKIGDFKVEYQFQAKCKKALTQVSGA